MNIKGGNKESSFVKQAAILAAAGLFSRFLGFLYKVPLFGLIGTEGNGIYSGGYNIYNFFLILSSAGLPAAISKMISHRVALGQYREAQKVFRVSFAAAGALGLFCALLFGFNARFFSNIINSERAYYTIMTLAPTVLIVALMAVIRGFFQGQNNSTVTAVSQVIEQLFNAVFSVVLAYLFMQLTVRGPNLDKYALGAAGGTAGTGVGAIAGFAFLVLIYIMAKPDFNNKVKKDKTTEERKTNSQIVSELVKTAVPIIAGTAIFSISNLIDTAMVKGRLINAAGFDEKMSDALFGNLNLKFVTMTTLPVSISMAFATAAIPSIVASLALKNKKDAYRKMNSALRITMMISIPAAIGMGVLAEPIINMLFPSDPSGAVLLQIGAISVIFLALAQIVTGMLQSLGKLKVPVIGAAIGCLLKIPINYFLVGIPEINVLGAVISTIVCYMVASIFDWVFLERAIKVKLDVIAVVFKPLLASIVMGLSCYVSYNTIKYIINSNTFAAIVSILLGTAVYFIYMFLIKGIKEEDILTMPAGNKICAVLKRNNIL